MVKKYLHSLTINNEVIGIDKKSWSEDDYTVPVFLITQNISESGYTNISSIINWNLFMDDFREKYFQIRFLFEETTWESLTIEEKKIVAKHFLVDKTKRDEVLTQQDQDNNNYFKLYNFVTDDVINREYGIDLFTTPKSIDYKKYINGNFNPDYTFDENGWLIECTYYEYVELSQDAQGFTQYDFYNPILKVEASYDMKPDGYVGSREVNRRWYRLDGTLDPDSKITTKVYTPMMARDEGKRRRRNLVNNLMIETVGLFIMTSVDLSDVLSAEADAMPFLKEISSGLSDYYEYGSKQDASNNNFLLKQQVIDSTYHRLDNFVPDTNDTVTIRQFIISKIDV